MPRNPTTGIFDRVSNSFSDPIVNTVIDPGDAIELFNDYDSGLTFDDSDPLILIGSTSGVLTILAPDTASGTLTLPAGTTDFSATGGAGRFVKQNSAGGALTVETVPAGEISAGAALTKTDDTNVTLTLGGTPAAALLVPASITAGWTGQLAVARGGTGAATLTVNGVLYGNGTSAVGATAAGTDGQILRGNSGGAPLWTVTPQIGAASLGTGTLTLGGNTSGAVTIQPQAAAGTYNFNLPTGAGTSGQPLLSGGGGATAMTFGTLGPSGGGTGLTSLGTGVATALGTNVGTAGAFVVNGGALGTPSSGTLTNVTGLPLSGLTAQAAYSFVLNSTGGSASPTAVEISTLATKASPAAGDYVMLSDQAASGEVKKATVSSIAAAGSVASFNGQTGAVVGYWPPQGRVTLTSGTPVMTATTSGQTTVYYTPYVGDLVPLYDGTNVVPTVFAELSQATTDATKSPAAVAANSVYDIFVWDDGGTIRATRGPPWTNDTTRSAGTGIVRIKGILLNDVAITNGPAANRGTYVGSIRSNSSSQIDYIFGGIGAGGVAGNFSVYNAYNQVTVTTFVGDSTDSWTYNVANTWRSANASAGNRVSFLRGLNEDSVLATYVQMVRPDGNTVSAGIGADSTTAPTGIRGSSFFSAGNLFVINNNASYAGTPGFGYRFVQAIEAQNNTTSTTYYGDTGGTFAQSGLTVSLRQ